MNFQNLPKKESYRFKEITSLTGVKPYVLRFWESEFTQIAPSKSENGEKVYSQNDLSCVETIRDLLFQDKLSIPQAKMYLDKETKNEQGFSPSSASSQETVIMPVEAQAAISNDEEYKSIETRESIGSLFKRSSSIEGFQKSLKQDLDAKKDALASKQFSDSDVLNLVKAKKKLTATLSRIDEIIAHNHW